MAAQVERTLEMIKSEAPAGTGAVTGTGTRGGVSLAVNYNPFMKG